MNIKKIIPMVTILSLFPAISAYADDSEFTTLYPIDITDSYYNQQDGEKITDFYGGYASATREQAIALSLRTFKLSTLN